ncbi:signal peptidase 22 kDa subunit [Dichomitus squalens]|uniref:Signal peptidase subunit 3 n=1 Tax=Dichomitus squalens TaxID=114155 RepID=A0A4Q9PZB2_9APHY|nr:signal peptidase 22 kDa subunit [Dichomitus squalens LYAD-421 SS1]EJF65231.1 signal peptidase 22 kDa subunit [Dichomitus squalens LYAD-421 SS1]TBU25161.1 signal peptidase 22 kDa subunit [Dichomitus squalens]TBU48626.1 signal peptidase 22 kDa subunit [Dichomitus squalens]TBU59684.1 signal peptidase 22 kDa subunit [Dichomitus squalens]
MHSIYSRINNVSAMLSTCLMVLLGAISLSSFLFTSTPPPGTLAVTNVKVFPGNARRYANKYQDFAFVNFNLTADLKPLFNWNTKQLFIYVSAEYENRQGTKNEVVIFDRIVQNKEDAYIDIAGRNKYVFRDVSASFEDSTPAHYSLKYNVMPYVGILTYGEAARTVDPVPFPESQDLS